MKRLILSLVTACAMPLFTQAKPVVRDGEPFPKIILPTVDDGTSMSIESFRGQKLMLHIFASW